MFPSGLFYISGVRIFVTQTTLPPLRGPPPLTKGRLTIAHRLSIAHRSRDVQKPLPPPRRTTAGAAVPLPLPLARKWTARTEGEPCQGALREMFLKKFCNRIARQGNSIKPFPRRMKSVGSRFPFSWYFSFLSRKEREVHPPRPQKKDREETPLGLA